MHADTYTEYTSQSLLGRLGNAIKGILIGLVLIAGAGFLLFWNEGRSVTTHKALQEGAGLVVSVDAARVNPANQGKLVHVTGTAETDDVVQDPDFGVQANALRLIRSVEMYQWEEEKDSKTRKKVGGGTETETVYRYRKTWSSEPINSGLFKRTAGHENPGTMPYRSKSFRAKPVTLGDFTLPPALVMDIREDEPLAPESPVSELPSDLRRRARPTEHGYYVGDAPGSPKVGDLRISFSAVPPQPVSVIARQVGSSFAPYTTSVGKDIQRLQEGTHTAAAMFEAAEAENTLLTWGLRALGVLVMFVGLRLLLGPVGVVMDVVPMLGNIVGMGLSLVSFLLALVVSLVIIAVAWVFYRPLLGGALLVLALAGVAALWRLRAKKGQPPPPPQPEPVDYSSGTPAYHPPGPPPGPPGPPPQEPPAS